MRWYQTVLQETGLYASSGSFKDRSENNQDPTWVWLKAARSIRWGVWGCPVVGQWVLLQNIWARVQVMVWLLGVVCRVWPRLRLEVTKLYVNNKTVSPLLHYFQGAILWPSSVPCLYSRAGFILCAGYLSFHSPTFFYFHFCGRQFARSCR